MDKLYTVVEDKNKRSFERYVQNHLNSGWELSGSVTHSGINGTLGSKYSTYCQAMVKKVKEDVK